MNGDAHDRVEGKTTEVVQRTYVDKDKKDDPEDGQSCAHPAVESFFQELGHGLDVVLQKYG